jgi:predicted aldo/keto reductase-like oxidoreductase
MQFNALFCLSRPEVHTLSIGAARPGDFDEHMRALADYERADEVMRPIEARLRAEMDRVLGADWCQRWFEGVPEYVAVPGEINLREILRLWTYAKGLGLVEWGKMRYNLLGRGDHWFPGENAAKADRDELGRVLAQSPFAARIPAILQEAHALLVGPAEQRLSQSLRRNFWNRVRRVYWRWR